MPKKAHKNQGSQTAQKGQKSKKVRVHIYLDEEVVAGLREEGFNLSQLFNKLGRERLVMMRSQRGLFFTTEKLAGRAGFEPATFGLKSLNEMWDLYKGQFEKWLSGKVESQRTVKDYINALDRLLERHKISTIGELVSALQAINYSHHPVSALRNFITFLELYEIIDGDDADRIRKYAKMRKANADRTFITNEELRAAWEQVKAYNEKRRELAFKLLVFSGLRLAHVHYLLTNFDPENLILQDNIAKYPLQEASKGTKRVFYAYMPVDFARELERIEDSYDAMREWVRRFKPPAHRVKSKIIRKWHFNFLLRHGVSFEVADFIQGRSAKSVGERHYANLELLADEAYAKVVEDLKKVLGEGYKIAERMWGEANDD